MKFAVIALLLATAGCDQQFPLLSVQPICDALIGPLRYNSTNPSSQRYAAPLLAMDVKQRNYVYIKLGCARKG